MSQLECDVCTDEYGDNDFNYCSKDINDKCKYKYCDKCLKFYRKNLKKYIEKNNYEEILYNYNNEEYVTCKDCVEKQIEKYSKACFN